MDKIETEEQGVLKEVGQAGVHLVGVVVGLLLLLVALGMGVTMVMLPMGFVVAILAVLTIAWGVSGTASHA